MAEVTNYIDRLVAELCPDGVEYRSLGDVVEYAKKREKDGTGVHLYVGVENLKSDFLGCSPVNGSKGGIIFQKDDILLGNIRPYLKKMWLSNVEGVSSPDVLVLRIQENEEDNIVAKYLYYILSSSKFVAYNISHSRGGKMPRGNKAKILEFEFPVPPMEIQEAIVEILDKFTNLEARTLQYEYYRGSLFGALKDPATGLPAIAGLVKTLCPDGVEYRSLKDVVAKNYGGGTPSKSKAEYWGGGIPWASVGDLSDDVLEVTDTRSKITEEGVKGSSTNVVPAGSVIVAIKINPGRMKIAGMDLAINQDIRGLVLNDSMNARFLTYYFRTLVFAGHGTIVKSITNKHLMETKIPVPPMEIQEAIVDILDRFDALTSSLSEGLPAELAARRSQYEYYRDQLLTFPRKGENQ